MTVVDALAHDPIDHPVPAGATARGTVLVVPGRGEAPTAYERLGRRLAVDAYPVRVLGSSAPAEIAAAVREVVAAEGAAPLALVGSDTGGLAVLAATALLTTAELPKALVVAGLPLSAPAAGADDLEGELALRSACPVHRGRLADSSTLRVGALGEDIDPQLLADAVAAAHHLAVPLLVLHGQRDEVAPFAEVWPLVTTWPSALLVAVSGGLHDALNDVHHRSVAARIVQLLEQVRLGADASPVLVEA